MQDRIPCIKTAAAASVAAACVVGLLFVQAILSLIPIGGHHSIDLSAPQRNAVLQQLQHLQDRHHYTSVPMLARAAVKRQLLTADQARRLAPQAAIRSRGSALSAALYSFVPVLCLLLLWPVYFARSRAGRGDPMLVPIALTLCLLNLVDLLSLRNPLSDTPLTTHQTVGILFGIFVFLLLSRMPEARRRSLRHYPYVWGLSALAIFLMLLLFGHGPGGVRLELGPLQPIEIAKLLLVLFAAAYLTERANVVSERHKQKRLIGSWYDLAPLLLLFGLSLLLFYICRDMGPGLLLFAVLAAMITITTGEPQFAIVGAVLILTGGILGYIAHVGVFPVRVDMWLHPFSNRYPQGMQLGQGLWGFSSSGLPGSGFGMGLPMTIPRGQDDLSFASWGEQGGWIGSVAVLTLFAILVARSMKIGTNAAHPFDRALAYGIGILFGMQTLLIVGGVTGIIPLTGLSLPFFSYGDSALLLDFAALGLLQGISQSTGQAAPIHQSVLKAAKVFTISCAVLLVGIVGIVRLGEVQVISSTSIATTSINTPDRDGVIRPHVNPRLLIIANTLKRASILDRQGKVIAASVAQSPNTNGAPVREYPLGASAVQVIGYYSRLTGAVGGIEQKYDYRLRGYSSLKDLLPYYRNRFMPGARLPRPQNVHSTLSIIVQEDAYKALVAACRRVHKSKGALIVLNADTGDVLAEVSLPALTPGQLATGTGAGQVLVTGEHPLVNRAVDGRYPPGSTFKLATAACALQDTPQSASLIVPCNRAGVVRWQAGGQYYSRLIHDDIHDPAFGSIGMNEAFTVSSNIYFATLATKIGARTFRAFLQEGPFARVPTLSAFRAELADIGYGQGELEVSPMQMALLAGAVANGGVLQKPRIVIQTGKMTAAEQYSETSLTGGHQWFSQQVAQAVRQMMVDVASRGTAAGLFNGLSGPIGAKTGTAQVGPAHPPHSWFVGYAHVSALPTIRRIAFACIIEHGGYGRTGAGEACAAMVRHLDGGTAN